MERTGSSRFPSSVPILCSCSSSRPPRLRGEQPVFLASFHPPISIPSPSSPFVVAVLCTLCAFVVTNAVPLFHATTFAKRTSVVFSGCPSRRALIAGSVSVPRLSNSSSPRRRKDAKKHPRTTRIDPDPSILAVCSLKFLRSSWRPWRLCESHAVPAATKQ
jgi:hypothetical protein